jgi:hypothetical protein
MIPPTLIGQKCETIEDGQIVTRVAASGWALANALQGEFMMWNVLSIELYALGTFLTVSGLSSVLCFLDFVGFLRALILRQFSQPQ